MTLMQVNDASYLRGYRFGASNVRAAAGTETRASGSTVNPQARRPDGEIFYNKLITVEKPTRFALGKGRVKFIVATHVDRFRYTNKPLNFDPYEAGYLDAVLDSVN